MHFHVLNVLSIRNIWIHKVTSTFKLLDLTSSEEKYENMLIGQLLGNAQYSICRNSKYDHFYTLLIDCILILSMRLGRIEILIWDPSFLGDIWSARNSKTFEISLSVRQSVRPSVVITIASNFANRLLLAIDRSLSKMACIVHSIWYIPYKPNRYTEYTGIPHLIFRFVYIHTYLARQPYIELGLAIVFF